MMPLGTKGQGESLIKLLVVAIIAIIALALAKSYFRESSRHTQQTVEEIFEPASTTTNTLIHVSPPILSLLISSFSFQVL